MEGTNRIMLCFKRYFAFLICVFSIVFLSACNGSFVQKNLDQAIKNIDASNDTLALQHIDKALKYDGENGVALSLKAYLDARRGDFLEADKLIQKAVVLDQNSYQIRLNSAKVLYLSHDYRRALAEATMASTLSKNDVAAESLKPLAMFKAGDRAEAFKYIQSVVKNNLDSPMPLLTLGKLYLLDRNYKAAEQSFRKVVAQFPDNLEAANSIFICQIKQYHLPELSVIEQQLKKFPDNPKLHYIKAEILYNQNKIQEAEPEVDMALASDNQNVDAYLLKGSIAIAKSNLSDVKYNLSRALQVEPENGEALCANARLQLMLENPNEAFRLLEQAMKLDPKFALSYAYKSDLMLRLGKLDESLALLKKGEKWDPNEPLTQLYLARIYIIKRDPKKAEAHIDRSLKIAPNVPMAIYYKASVRAISNDFPSAIKYLNQAVKNGFIDSAKLQSDFCWKPYMKNPQFISILNKVKGAK